MKTHAMSQLSFSDAEYAGKRKKTRGEVFLHEMELVVPWKVLLKIIEPHYPVAAGKGGPDLRATEFDGSGCCCGSPAQQGNERGEDKTGDCLHSLRPLHNDHAGMTGGQLCVSA